MARPLTANSVSSTRIRLRADASSACSLVVSPGRCGPDGATCRPSARRSRDRRQPQKPCCPRRPDPRPGDDTPVDNPFLPCNPPRGQQRLNPVIHLHETRATPTTATATAASPGDTVAPSWVSPTLAPSPTTPPPTARWNASTVPWSTNGPTLDYGPQTANEPEHLTRGYIDTTITDTTPP